MTGVEISIVAILLILFALVKRFCLPSGWRTMTAFLWAALLGLCFQFLLGPELNAYNENLQLYVGYVSLALVINWCIVLNICYFFSMALIDKFRLSPPFLFYILFGLVTLVIIESLGYNFFEIRLAKRYPSLLPCFNCMHAPVTLYLYYALVAISFYLSMTWIRSVTSLRERAVDPAAPDSRP